MVLKSQVTNKNHYTKISPLCKKCFIVKFLDKVNLENTLLVSKPINNLLHSLLNVWFLFSSEQHKFHKPSYKTNIYGKNSIVVSAINAWNNSQKLLKICLRHLFPNKIKKTLPDPFFTKY